MSSATGLSVMDVAVLDALDHGGATPDRYVKNKRVLDEAFQRHDIPPRPGYRVLCDLSRWWVVHLPLVDFHGNAGSPDFGPASPFYTESRLSPLGAVALASERGEIGPLPIGLIIGNTHVDGPKPPFDPARVLAALRAVAAGAPDDNVIDAIGSPSFPTGCRVRCDSDQLVSGARTGLHLTARVVTAGPNRLTITNLPPDSSCSEVAMSLQHRAEHRTFGMQSPDSRLPIKDINDQSSAENWIVDVTLEPDADHEAVIADIEGIWGVYTEIDVTLGRPLATLLHEWVDLGSRDDLDERLDIIANAISE